VHSRMLDSDDIPTRLVNVSAGERYVRLAHDRHIHVLDFNPHHVRMELAGVRVGMAEGSSADSDSVSNDSTNVQEGTARIKADNGPGEGGSVQVVYGRTKLTHGSQSNPWQKKIYSELPYVLTVSNRRYRVGGVVVDEERILGLKVRCASFPRAFLFAD
jgi:hypothetical protein